MKRIRPLWMFLLASVGAVVLALDETSKEQGIFDSVLGLLSSFASVVKDKGDELVGAVRDTGGDLISGKVCDKLIDSNMGFVDKEAKKVADKVKCTCGLGSGTALELTCSFPDPVCDKVEGGRLCGFLDFYGSYKVGGIFRSSHFMSTICLTFSSDGKMNDDVSSFSKVCIEANHVPNVDRIDQFQACSIYALRKAGSKDACADCKICGEHNRSFQFDCSGLDVNEDKNLTFFLPKEFNSKCVGAGYS
jgi:hypothetical protein